MEGKKRQSQKDRRRVPALGSTSFSVDKGHSHQGNSKHRGQVAEQEVNISGRMEPESASTQADNITGMNSEAGSIVSHESSKLSLFSPRGKTKEA